MPSQEVGWERAQEQADAAPGAARRGSAAAAARMGGGHSQLHHHHRPHVPFPNPAPKADEQAGRRRTTKMAIWVDDLRARKVRGWAGMGGDGQGWAGMGGVRDHRTAHAYSAGTTAHSVQEVGGAGVTPQTHRP
jgi:hypothetical protein